MQADPFQSWRHPTGRTGARGDYTDDQHQGHKKIAQDYAKNHRVASNAAKEAASHPGADPEAYINEKNRKEKVVWNTNPAEVSWSGAKLACTVQPYEGDKLSKEQRVYQHLIDRRLTGTWDRNERIPVRTNRTALIRKTLRESERVIPENINEESTVKRGFSLKSLKRSPGLPYYTPREPKIVEMTSNSARLRKQH
jgi:hypothetical protein